MGIHNGQLIPQVQGGPLIMGNVENRGANIALQFSDFVEHLIPQLCIQIGNRFVQDDQTVTAHQSPGNGHPLLLSARELAGKMIDVLTHAHLFEYILDSSSDFFPLDPPFAQGICNVFLHG